MWGKKRNKNHEALTLTDPKVSIDGVPISNHMVGSTQIQFGQIAYTGGHSDHYGISTTTNTNNQLWNLQTENAALKAELEATQRRVLELEEKIKNGVIEI
jgi:hypothetical protein